MARGSGRDWSTPTSPLAVTQKTGMGDAVVTGGAVVVGYRARRLDCILKPIASDRYSRSASVDALRQYFSRRRAPASSRLRPVVCSRWAPCCPRLLCTMDDLHPTRKGIFSMDSCGVRVATGSKDSTVSLASLRPAGLECDRCLCVTGMMRLFYFLLFAAVFAVFAAIFDAHDRPPRIPATWFTVLRS